MNKRVAIIKTGHHRMVPYGYKLDVDGCWAHGYDPKFYSYSWSDESECKPVQVHPNLGDTKMIIDSLEDRSVVVNQKDIMMPMWEALCKESPYIPPYEHFSRFSGQIIGFLLPLEKWKHQLTLSDIIVKSRWDHVVDASILETITYNEFQTRSVYLTNGFIEMSGDTIFGSTNAWLEHFLPYEKSLDELFEIILTLANTYGCLPIKDVNAAWWWFNSHTLWGHFFQKKGLSIHPGGESIALIPSQWLETAPASLNVNLFMDTHFKKRWNG